MEKLIGEKIPGRVLCINKLNRVRITAPSGRYLEGNMPLLNFWRRDVDSWLNELAVNAGAHMFWGGKISGFDAEDDCANIKINSESIKTKYVIGADGLSPVSYTRKYLFPENFSSKVTGASLNLHYEGWSSVRPDTLYLYYRRRLSDLMYSWVFYKNDILVIGTSSTEKLGAYTDAFLEMVKTKFDIVGTEIRREGYSTYCKGGVFLGKDRVLLAGDAAGFLDLYRGVGMDSAALSGRLAALSIIDSLKGGEAPLRNYKRRSEKLVSMINKNAIKQTARYESDGALEDSLSYRNVIKGNIVMAWYKIWNSLCKPEEIKLLPP
jgi:flavin-dependent dehydrogenase